MQMQEDFDRIAAGYRRFAEVEAAPVSARYAELAAAVAGDPAVLRFLAELPRGKRQPNLLFATLQYLHGEAPTVGELPRWVLDDADRVRDTMLARATQTNEPARCGALLPLLSALEQPVALIEVGASAGLCLYPDRYSYDYYGRPVGPPSPVHVHVETSGDGPVPDRLPEVTARIGIDLNPLDVTDADDRAWLRALVWPGPSAAARLDRLDAAADIVRTDPPRMLRGDLVEQLPEALALVPENSAAVVFHTAVLPYVPSERRTAFVDLVRESGVRWISQEGPGALPDVDAQLPDPDEARGRFLLALDGQPLAWTAPHGGHIDWLPPA